ncbi:hypothetical protein BDR26DRAFT_863740, partial [Obelidium mucronatum]
MFQLPFCASSVISQDVLNRNKYPYYFETTSVTGYGQALFLLLNVWGVTRMGVISSSANSCPEVVETLTLLGIEIAAHVRGVSYTNAKFVADTLEQVDVRYILFCGDGGQMGNMYLTLGATLKRLVGPKYVWFTMYGMNYKSCPGGNCTAAFGQNFVSLFQGVKMIDLKTSVTKQVRKFQAPWGNWGYDLSQYFNFMASYDCTATLAYGFNTLLKGNSNLSPQTLASRSLQGQLNYTAFSQTGYSGLTSDPLTLTKNGDSAAPFIFAYFRGNAALNIVYFGSTNMDRTIFEYTDYSANSDNITISDNQMTFYGGSHIPPPDGPIYRIDSISPASKFGNAVILLTAFGFLLGTVSCWFIVRNRSNPAIRTGSVLFLLIMCVGTLPAYGSLLLSLNQETVFGCVLRPWLQLISFSIIAGCLIVKTNDSLLMDSTFLMALAGIVGIEAILLGIYTHLSKRKIVRSILNEEVIQYICVNNSAGLQMEYALWVYNGLVVGLLFLIAYATRNVNPRHNEVTILVVLGVSLVIGAVLINVMYHDTTSHSQAAFSTVIIVWILNSLPIFLSLVPRYFQLCRENVYLTSRYLKSFMQQSTSQHRQSKSLTNSKTPKSSIPKSHATNNRKLAFADPIPVVYCLKSSNPFTQKWVNGVVSVGFVEKTQLALFLPALADIDGESKVFPIKRLNTDLGDTVNLGGSENPEAFRIFLKTESGTIMMDFEKADRVETLRQSLILASKGELIGRHKSRKAI